MPILLILLHAFLCGVLLRATSPVTCLRGLVALAVVVGQALRGSALATVARSQERHSSVCPGGDCSALRQGVRTDAR